MLSPFVELRERQPFIAMQRAFGKGQVPPRPTLLVYRNALLPHSETFVLSQFRAFRHFKPVLIGKELLNELELGGAEYEVIGSEGTQLWQRAVRRLRRQSGFCRHYLRLSARKPALLLAHFGPDALDAYPIAKRLGVPIVIVLHGYDINCNEEWWLREPSAARRNYLSNLRRLALKRGAFFVAVSEAVRREAIKKGLPSEKIFTNFIGVDPELFQPGATPVIDRRARVLFIGRLVEKKACELLVRAMADVRRAVPHAELVVGGDGPLRERVERVSEELGVNASLIGTLSPDDVRRELDAARVFCLPSIRAASGDAEGLPIVILEAQAKGVPVVTSSNQGNAEAVVHGETGLLVDPHAPGALSNALTRLLTDDALCARCATAGPVHIRNRFDLHACTARLERAMSSLITHEA